jgi:hypothetical protein
MSVYVKMPFGSWGCYHPLLPQEAEVVRDTEYTEKSITYRLKTRIAGVPILPNWDKWKAPYEKNKQVYFFSLRLPIYL